ncbi:MAG: hypothetical protein LC658_12710, partial [Bacteroidales bacterium]|nr:hypothetical protein [Bacteroidales bacterium]
MKNYLKFATLLPLLVLSFWVNGQQPALHKTFFRTLHSYINSSFPSALGGMRGLRNDRYTFIIQRNNSGKITNTILFDNKNDLWIEHAPHQT